MAKIVSDFFAKVLTVISVMCNIKGVSKNLRKTSKNQKNNLLFQKIGSFLETTVLWFQKHHLVFRHIDL